MPEFLGIAHDKDRLDPPPDEAESDHGTRVPVLKSDEARQPSILAARISSCLPTNATPKGAAPSEDGKDGVRLRKSASPVKINVRELTLSDFLWGRFSPIFVTHIRGLSTEIPVDLPNIR